MPPRHAINLRAASAERNAGHPRRVGQLTLVARGWPSEIVSPKACYSLIFLGDS
jgi:hypothetical protein